MAHFSQPFRQVKTWLILELHRMTTASNLVACPIVFVFFCFEILVDMEECSNIWEMVSSKYFLSLWLISSEIWVSLGADHTVFLKNCDSRFYNCVSNGFYCALKSRQGGVLIRWMTHTVACAMVFVFDRAYQGLVIKFMKNDHF